MNDLSGTPQQLETVTMLTILVWLQTARPYAYATRADYIAQIKRCASVYNANRLEDIPADLSGFQQKFTPESYPAEHFKTFPAYKSWRKKVICALRGFGGDIEASRLRRASDDQWSRVLYLAGALVGTGTARTPHMLIPIRVLADEGRKAGRQPFDLDQTWLAEIEAALPTARRRAISNAVRNLEELRRLSADLDAMFPVAKMADPASVRRLLPIELPMRFNDQIRTWVKERCAGEFDEILEERTNAKSASTAYVYTAALKKYVGDGLRIGAVSENISPIEDIFDRQAFNQIVRNWIVETDAARQISDRTMRAYISNLMIIASSAGKPVDFMKTAMKTNRNLMQGKHAAQTMPLTTRVFCARILRNRNAELTFKSLHLIFKGKASDILARENRSALENHRIVQFGILAALSALELWGVPLRIGNATTLKHKGAEPTLILPTASRDRAHLNIPADDVKNRKRLRGHISAGKTQGLEVLNWYLREIRDRLPWAEQSDYLFPGYDGPVISDQSVRNWLIHHTRELGLPMTPHNFRHGIASLYLREHPGEYSAVARLLGNTPDVVRTHYAWIDDEAEMEAVQQEVARLGGILK